jgi:hypothetical protein
MNHPNVAEITRTVIRNHPKDCVFTPNAVENIVAKWNALKISGNQAYSPMFEDFMVDALLAEEIYCPHEGIDRRSEYYGKINLAGWMEWASIAHEMV